MAAARTATVRPGSRVVAHKALPGITDGLSQEAFTALSAELPRLGLPGVALVPAPEFYQISAAWAWAGKWSATRPGVGSAPLLRARLRASVSPNAP